MQAERRPGRPVSGRRHRTRAEQVQNRRVVLAVCLLALMVVITAVSSYASRAEASPEPSTPVADGSTTTTLDPAAGLVSATYSAQLQAGTSDYATGDPRALLTLAYDATAQTLSYRLTVTSPLPNPNVAAICQGAPGQSGITVVTLFPGPSIAGDFSGALSEGNITAGDLVGPLQGAKVTDLVLLLQSGGAYVTIGTTSHPIDAIRGQIK